MDQLLMRRPDLNHLPQMPALPPGYNLREYQESDLEPLAELMRAAFEDEKWTPEKVRQTLIEAPEVRKLL